MLFRKIPLCLFAVLLVITQARAKQPIEQKKFQPLTPEQTQVIEKAMYREGVLIRTIQEHVPVVETYIQDTRPDDKLYEVPVSDRYMLSRVDFDKDFFNRNYTPRQDARRSIFATAREKLHQGSESMLMRISHELHLDVNFTQSPLGFTEMMFFDPESPEMRYYEYGFVRKEFLGSVRTWVFDVQPKGRLRGGFAGRIWIEDQDNNIVRIDGTFAPLREEETRSHVLHFDSWRNNVRPGIWLPAVVYVEETHRDKGRDKVGLKAQTRFWGFALKLPPGEGENVSVTVDDAVDKSDNSEDVSPLQATRAWETQAENNVVDRLEKAGLVAPLTQDGYEQKVLDQIVTNLAVPSNLAFMSQVHCRILLTTTIEATTAGNTILISKGALDSLPNEESIASVVAMELAHIELGHRIDTRYAFNDRLLFPDEATLQRMDMYHNERDDEAAAKRAMEYLTASMYGDKLGSAGLYWKQVADRGKALKQLNTPRIGDSLLRADGSPWMAALAAQAPNLNPTDLKQTAALPLGSWLRTDAWDDSVHMLNAKRYAPMNPTEKMPLELTPVYFNLKRLDLAPEQAGVPSAPQPATGDDGTPTADAIQAIRH